MSDSNNSISTFELDETTGQLVMTRAFLLSRGSCCGNGCRNCPYGEIPQEQTSSLPKEENARDVNCLWLETGWTHSWTLAFL